MMLAGRKPTTYLEAIPNGNKDKIISLNLEIFMTFNTREVLKKHDLKLTKTLGQNFLTDVNIINRIIDAASVSADDMVIEIGAGIGAMTCNLAEKAGRVVTIEIDRKVIPALMENISSFTNVAIINEDVLKVNFEEIIKDWSGPVKVVANLPYYITTPIIMGLLEKNLGISLMVFMIQKEVAYRIAAQPGTKDYGSLSVAAQYYSRPKTCFNVSPNCFIPKPDVDSTVIKMELYDKPSVEVKNKESFFMTVKAAFSQRRKTLLNTVSNFSGFDIAKKQLEDILNDIGIDPQQRGETLDIKQFALLSNRLYEFMRSDK